MAQRVYDLEERLINFAVQIIELTDVMPKTPAGIPLAGQLLRSGTHPGIRYGEAQAAESKRDFIHKMKVSLKELRGSYASIRIMLKARLHPDPAKLEVGKGNARNWSRSSKPA
jgi:four helix bundle protein